MKKIVDIVWKTNKPPRIYALIDTEGDTVYWGYGHDFKVGDMVRYFHDAKWDANKMEKPKPLKTIIDN